MSASPQLQASKEEGKEEDGVLEGVYEAEIYEENLPLTRIFRLSTGGKGVVEDKKIIPSRFDISPYPNFGGFVISLFCHSTI